MKKSMVGLALLLAVSISASGQATPTASTDTPRYNPGPSLPLIDGNLQYALTGSEIFQGSAYGQSGFGATTNLSGDVEYLSKSAVHPFTLLYAGGVLFSTYAGQGVDAYQSLSVSQGLVGHGWAIGAADSMSLLPQSPTTGLSGIPGAGDLGLQPITDPLVPPQYVLTNYERRIMNNLSVNVERQLTNRTSLTGTGNYGILNFLGDDPQGLNSTQVGGSGGFNHLLNRRSSFGVNVQYSTFFYSLNPTSFDTYGLSVQYTRQLSKTISLQASAGPQWVSSFQAVPVATGIPTVGVAVPASLGVQTSVGLTIARKVVNFGVSYSHGVNNGSGLQTGAISDSASGSASRSYGRMWATSASLSYARTSGLVDNSLSSTVFGGVQVNRRLTNTLSGFMSYTAVTQSANSTLFFQNAFNGFTQSFSIGVTFAPRMTRLGQF
jgi:hypothetical protein